MAESQRSHGRPACLTAPSAPGSKNFIVTIRCPADDNAVSVGGRKPLEDHHKSLISAIDRLVEPTERGDPQSPLRWTCKSLTNLQHELRCQGLTIGRTKIAKVLRSLGYSLQGNRKTREGNDHPDRNAQFEHIARRVRACQRAKRPAVSVDTKKKETLGKKANVGLEYRPKGQPLEVDTHDFPDKELGKAIPYGVYDIDSNEAWVSVGISRDTGEFAVEAIRRWWAELGSKRYATAKRLLITADAGWEQQSSGTALEVRTATLGRRNGNDPGGVSLSTGHEQMEQD